MDGIRQDASCRILDEDQAATVAAALDDAVAGIRERVRHCGECTTSPAGLCEQCAGRLDRAEAYFALALVLRGTR